MNRGGGRHSATGYGRSAAAPAPAPENAPHQAPAPAPENAPHSAAAPAPGSAPHQTPAPENAPHQAAAPAPEHAPGPAGVPAPKSAPLSAPVGDLRIVLVRPEESRNVGAACRAAKTMGIESLYLVGAEAIDLHAARVVAVHAANVLERAVTCSSVAEAVRGCSLAAAVTRRDGKHRKYRIWTAEQLGRHLAARQPGPVALVFGNEKNGLSDAEMEPCQVAVAIPTSPGFPSLNLSHAVQVVAYEVFKHGAAARRARPRQRPVGAERLARLAAPLTAALAEVGFFSTDGARSVQRFLTDIFTRADLVDREAQRLERILHNVGGVVLRTKR